MLILPVMPRVVCTSTPVRQALALIFVLSSGSAPLRTEAASTYRFGAQGIALGDTLAIQQASRLRLEIGQRHSSVSRQVVRPGDEWRLIPDGLEVETAEPMLSFPQPSLVRVDVPHGRSTLRGALVGAAVLGVVPGIALLAAVKASPSISAEGTLAGGAAGFGVLTVGTIAGACVGAVVGYTRTGWRAAYEAQ